LPDLRYPLVHARPLVSVLNQSDYQNNQLLQVPDVLVDPLSHIMCFIVSQPSRELSTVLDRRVGDEVLYASTQRCTFDLLVMRRMGPLGIVFYQEL